MIYILFAWWKKNPSTPIKGIVQLFELQRLLVSQNIPTYHRESRRLLLGLSGIVEQTFEVCPIGCRLYRLERGGLDLGRKEVEACPDCGTARDPTCKVTVLGLTNQLLMLQMWPEWSEATTHKDSHSHCDSEIEESDADDLYHVRDSDRFRAFLQTNPSFARDYSHLLQMMTDGFEPWPGYSMWPVLFKDLNLFPVELLARSELLILYAIVHGPKSPKNMRGLFLLLKEELDDLFDGVEFNGRIFRSRFGARFREMCFTLRAAVHSVLGDYPALAKVYEQKTAGAYFACLLCFLKGKYLSVTGRNGNMEYGDSQLFLRFEDAVGEFSQAVPFGNGDPERCAYV